MSDGKGETVLGEHGSDLPFAHHRQALVASDRPTRGLDALEPEPRPDQPLDATALPFDNVIEMLDLTELDEARQLAVLLQRLAEETPSGGTALGAEQKVDRLPTRIDGAVQIHPAALLRDVGLVHPPGAGGHVQMRTQALVQFRRIGLDPAEDGCVIDGDAAVSQHAFQIAVADRELQVPANC